MQDKQIETYNKIIEQINQEETLRFLRPYLTVVHDSFNDLKSTSTEIIRSDERHLDKDENDIIILDNFHRLTREQWNQLWLNIVTCSHTKFTNPEYSSIPGITKSFETCITVAIDNIINTKKKINWIILIRNLYYYKSIALPAIIKSIHYNINLEISAKRRKEKRDIQYITYTSTALNIGEALLEVFLNKQPIFANFISFYKKEAIVNNISEKDVQLMYQLLTAAIVNDKDQVRIILKQSINIKDFIIDDLILELIPKYFLVLFIKENEKNNNPFFLIQNLFEEYKIINSYNYEKYLKTTLLQLGAFILDECANTTIDSDTNTKLLTIENVFESNKKERKVIKFPDSLLYTLLTTSSINKPFLTPYNAAFARNEGLKTNMVLNLVHENKNKFVHPSVHMTLDLKPNTYLATEKPQTRLVIDKLALFNIFNYLIYAKNSAYIEDSVIPIIVSSFYNIDITSVTNSPKELNLLDLLLRYALDFNDTLDYINEINTCLNDIKKNDYKNVYVKINNKIRGYFNIIRNNKYIIKTMLIDCIIYLPFKYIIQDSFICTRGRLYINNDFTNIQVFPLAKTFFKPYSNLQGTTQEFKVIKEAVISLIKSKDIANDLEKMTFKTYEKEAYEKNITYIKSYFIKRALISDNSEVEAYDNLMHLIDNIHDLSDDILYSSNIFFNINKFVKKKNRTFLVQSLIWNSIKEPWNPFMKNYYELDATASGLQMSAMLLKSAEMAKSCNLSGTENIDVYNTTVKTFSSMYKEIKIIYNDFITGFGLNDMAANFNGEKSICIHISYFKNKLSFTKEQLFEDFIALNIAESSMDAEFILEVYNKLNMNNALRLFINKLTINLEDYSWLLMTEERKYFDNPKIKIEKNILLYMLIIKNVFKVIKTFEKYNLDNNDKFFNWRELFKDAIMTYFYNSTAYGRKEKFIELLEEFLYDIPKNNDKDFFKDCVTMSSFLEKYFSSYINTIIKDSELLFKLSDILSKRGKPVYFTNEFFQVKYFPKKAETSVICTPTYNKKRGSQLVIKLFLNEFNAKEFDKGFIPNCMHFCDGTICHKFKFFMFKLNEICKYFYLFSHTNHDNFNVTIVPFLKYIIEDCYLDFLNSHPLKLLFDFLDEETKKEILALITDKILNLIRLNPYFVK